MEVKKDWYGWIPNLACDLLPDHALSFLEDKRLSEEELNQLNIPKEEGKTCYSWSKKFTDEREGSEHNVVISLNEEGLVEKVFIFDDRKRNLLLSSSCEIEDMGLIRIFNISGSIDAKKGVKQIYILIRDVYHYHTHHEEHEDLLLPPVEADSREEGVLKILREYRQKIPSYHRELKELINSEKLIIKEKPLDEVKEASESVRAISIIAGLIKKAKGEMLYAITFWKLHSDKLDGEELSFPFSNSYKSFDTLGEEVDRINNSNLLRNLISLSQKTGNLTLWITFLTIVMAILAVVNIFL